MFWRVVLAWPIRRLDQALFALALAEAIDAGIEISEAMALAARVNPSFRFRHALATMRRHVRAGYSLEAALAKTSARIDPRLRAALHVGEEHGCLADELTAFARDIRPDAGQKLCQTLGRRAEVTRFAAALARLLRQRGLTPELVESAGRVASAGNRDFSRAVAEIMEDLKSGAALAEALKKHPSYFDPLYCGLLGAAQSRQQVRVCLERLGRVAQAT